MYQLLITHTTPKYTSVVATEHMTLLQAAGLQRFFMDEKRKQGYQVIKEGVNLTAFHTNGDTIEVECVHSL